MKIYKMFAIKPGAFKMGNSRWVWFQKSINILRSYFMLLSPLNLRKYLGEFDYQFYDEIQWSAYVCRNYLQHVTRIRSHHILVMFCVGHVLSCILQALPFFCRLRFEFLQQLDKGSYTCVAENKAKTLNTTAYLNVIARKFILSSVHSSLFGS